MFSFFSVFHVLAFITSLIIAFFYLVAPEGAVCFLFVMAA